MSLTSKAIQLEEVILRLLSCLRAKIDDSGIDRLAGRVYKDLMPLSRAYSNAIHVIKDRNLAQSVISEIREIFRYIGTVEAKGDIDPVDVQELQKFWELSAIFQETDLRDGALD